MRNTSNTKRADTEYVPRRRSIENRKRGEVVDFAEASKKIRSESYTQRILFQDAERYGALLEHDPRRKLLDRIKERLYAAAPQLPRGEARYLSSPDINAFVVKGVPDVFVYDGLVRQFLVWCEHNGEEPTEDAIALVFAHELGHIRQGTEEIDLEEEAVEKKSDYAETKAKHQRHINDEYDADRFGLQLIARAGYNPREGLKMVRFLIGLDEGLSLPTTHPRSADRYRELVALVESRDTIIPNTDKTPVGLDAQVLALCGGEQAERPGTALYRREGMVQTAEMMKRATNVYDAMEVGQVGVMHGYIQEIDTIRRSTEVRTVYAKAMVLENLDDIVTALQSMLVGSHTPASGHIYGSEHLPTSATRYAQREYGYMRADESYTSGRTVDANVGKALSRYVDGARRNLVEKIDRQVKEIDDENLTVPPATGKDYSAVYIRYRQQLLEIKARIDIVLEDVTERTIEDMVENVHAFVSEKEWAQDDDLSRALIFATVDEIVGFAKRSGTPVFSRLIHTKQEKIKKGLGGVAAVDSRYQPYLGREITGAADLRTPEGRREFIEQSVFQRVSNEFNHFLSGTYESHQSLTKPLCEAIEPGLVEVRAAMTEWLTHRYSALGEHARVYAEIITLAITSYTDSWDQRRKLEPLLKRVSPEVAQAWLDTVPEVAADFKSSARAVFLGESGIAKELFGTGRLNVTAMLFSVEDSCRAEMKACVERAQPGTIVADGLDEIISKMTLGPQYARSAYIAEAMTIVKAQRDWGAATKAELEETFSPILQVLSAQERSDFLQKTISIGHMPRVEHGHAFGDALPAVVDILTFAAEASPEYARHLFSHREPQLLSMEPEERRLEVLEFLYANGDVFTELRRGGYHDPAKEIYSRVGLEYIRLHTHLRGEDSFVDAIAQLTQGKFIVDGEKYPVFGDPALQARILSLPDADILRIATVAKESYVKTGFALETSQFVDVIMVRVLAMKGIVATMPLHAAKLTFDTSGCPFSDAFSHIADYVVNQYRVRWLAECQDAYGVDATTLVTGGYAAQMGKMDASVMKSGSEDYRGDYRAHIDHYAEQYSDTAAPFHETHLGKYAPRRAKMLDEYLALHPVHRDRNRSVFERSQAIIQLIPEITDFRDKQFADIERDALLDWGFVAEGHKVTSVIEPVSIENARELYGWYESVIPLCAGRVQAELWGRRANDLYEHFLGASTRSLATQLSRIQRVFPFASFARDEALFRLGGSALVQTPEHARAVQSLTTDLSRRSTQAEDIVAQSSLERVNTLMASLSRSEKKDFLLWMLGAQNQPPKTMRAYGGYYKMSFADLPAVVFAATAPEREQLFLRLMSGSNGVLEPQNDGDRLVQADFVDTAFDQLFPDDPVTGIAGEARRMLRTAFTIVFEEYDSYRGTQVFIGMVEVMRDAKDAQRGKRLVALMSELGPVFVKVGQVLSETESAPGVPLLPEDIREAMRTLKQDAKQFSRLASVFSLESSGEFAEDNPDRIVVVGKTLAAASIKQVSDATRADGKQVVEKVLRPSVEKHLREDERVLGLIVEKIRKFAEVPKGIEESGSAYVREESDFKREVENTKKISKALYDYQDRGVIRLMKSRTPEIYTYSERHIQEEKIRGISLRELMQLHRDPAQIDAITQKYELSQPERQYYIDLAKDPSQVTTQVFDAMAFQYFQADAFHADPHDANIFLPATGGIAFIDSGSIGESTQAIRQHLRRFFLGFALGRPKDLRAAVTAFAPGIRAPQLEEVVAIAQSTMREGDKMNRILKVVTSSTNALHPTFDKFLKSFGTGSYLLQTVAPIDQRLIMGAYTQGERGSNVSLIAIGGARILRELPQSRMGKMLARLADRPTSKTTDK